MSFKVFESVRFAAKGQCPFDLVGEAEANSIFWKNKFFALLIEVNVLPIDCLGRQIQTTVVM